MRGEESTRGALFDNMRRKGYIGAGQGATTLREAFRQRWLAGLP